MVTEAVERAAARRAAVPEMVVELRAKVAASMEVTKGAEEAKSGEVTAEVTVV